VVATQIRQGQRADAGPANRQAIEMTVGK
jgi:hypothetical protein